MTAATRTRPDWSALHEFEGVLLFRDVKVRELGAGFCPGYAYLATPYSLRAVDERGRWCFDRSIQAMEEANSWAWRLTRAGLSVVSPIVLAAEMVHLEYAGDVAHPDALDPLDHEAWTGWCRPMLSAAAAVAVPPIAGWDASRGVWGEVVSALRAGKPVYVLGEG